MAGLYTTFDFTIMLILRLLVPICLYNQVGVLGVAFYIAAYYAYYFVLKVGFGMERLAALDEFFLLDNDKNRANIICCVKTDRLPEYERIRTMSIELATKHPRLRHRVVKHLGEHYFKEMNNQELELATKKSFVRNDTIKSDKELESFIARE